MPKEEIEIPDGYEVHHSIKSNKEVRLILVPKKKELKKELWEVLAERHCGEKGCGLKGPDTVHKHNCGCCGDREARIAKQWVIERCEEYLNNLDHKYRNSSLKGLVAINDIKKAIGYEE